MNTAQNLLQADRSQMASFVTALFRYAEEGTFVSFRSFLDNEDGVAFSPEAVEIMGGLGPIIDFGVRHATNCANYMKPVVFCPPVVTLNNRRTATEADIANGLTLIVECDERAVDAVKKLTALIGPPTIVMASGGEWMNPETGEIEPKLHAHWRLTEPTTTPEDHRLLKQARILATRLVGGDCTSQPLVHPVRWAGSWHRKSSPKLATIVENNADAEIDLAEALEKLKEAAEAAGINIHAAPGKGAANDPGTGEDRVTAELIRLITTGTDYHAPIAALAMRLLQGGTPDAQVVLMLRGFMLSVDEKVRDLKGGTVQPGRWQSRFIDIPRAVSTARAKINAKSGQPQPHPAAPFLERMQAKFQEEQRQRAEAEPEGDPRPEPPPYDDEEPAQPKPPPGPDNGLVNPCDLVGVEPPEREWIIEEWLPRKTVTLLAGSGGTGKSLLAQQLQIATAIGRSFLGLETTECKSLALYCEDDNDELHRRGKSICWHYGASFADLGKVRWQGRFGSDNLLAKFLPDGEIMATALLDEIVSAMKRPGADLLILDNVAQLFGGNENDRSQVTQFVNGIGKISVEFNCAVLLLAHPGKSETGLTSQYSGSTGWDASVRSRWVLTRPKPEEGQEPKELSDLRVLTKLKANYSTIGDEIFLKWDQGAFAVEGADQFKDMVDKIDERNQEREDNERFLKCLDILADQQKGASHSSRSPNYAPKVMVGLEPWKSVVKSKRRIQAAMDRLFNDNVIVADQLLRPGSKRLNPLYGIARRGPDTRAGDKAEAGGFEGRPEASP